jgi:hypothetical protein
VSKVLKNVTRAIVRCLYDKYVQMPRGQKLIDTIQRCKVASRGVSMIAGAVDGSHIRLAMQHALRGSYLPSTGLGMTAML